MDDVGQAVKNFSKVILAVTIVVMTIVVLISMSILLMDVAFPVSDQNSSFTGNVESFNIAMQNPDMSFKAESIGLSANTVVFRSVKNILIDYHNGTETREDYLPAIQVEYDKTVAQPISDVEMNLIFNDVVIDKFSNHADIYGELTATNQMESNGGKVKINDGGVKRVLIDSKNITDFKQISFEMGDGSKVQIIPGDISISVTNISGLDAEKVKFSKITINNGEGELGLDGHDFDIKTIDNLNVEMLPKSDSFITIDNDNVHFDGTATSAKLNNDNILVNEYRYLLKFKPEKINAYATLGLAFITILYVIYTGLMVKQTEKSLKQTDNIINESKKDRQIALIINRLENFYYPLQNFLLLSVIDNRRNNPTTDTPQLTIPDHIIRHKNRVNDINYKDVINHQYLAEKKIGEELDYFLENILVKKSTQEENVIKRYDEFVKLIDEDIKAIRREYEELLSD